jgi:hypothetical protein
MFFVPDFLCIPLLGQSYGRQMYDDKGISWIGTSTFLSLLHPLSLLKSHRDFYRPPTLTEESVQKKKKVEKVYFYLRHNKLKITNLNRVFSEYRSGTIAHKHEKRITAVTHCPT